MRTAALLIFVGLWTEGASLHAQTVLDLDTSANAGITVASGTWDANQTVLWTPDAGATRVPWTTPANIARIQCNFATASTTLTVNNGNGQVGTAGLIATGSAVDWTVFKLAGAKLQVGSQGIARQIPNATVNFQADNEIELTASQTWTNITPSRLYNGGLFVLNGPVSGNANLTLDGADASDPGLTGGNDLRVGFRMNTNNVFAGSLTVSQGAFLWLPYATGVTNCLSDNHALVLRGGSVRFQGGTGVESVGSVLVQAGASHIGSGDAGVKTTLAMGPVTQQLGGTLNFAATTIATTTSPNTDGILGGWATVGSSWATGSGDGSPTLGSTSGTWRSNPSVWATGDNVDARGGGVLNKDVAINSLRLYNQSPATPIDLGSYAVTVNSGGILGGHSSGNLVIGGTLRSGKATGELIVHTVTATTIGSVVADNGAVPTVLVKSGATTNALTLTASNTYTGATYLNSGTLALTNNAVLRGAVVQAGGTTLDVRNGGSISPGGPASAATLTLNGNLTLGDGAVLDLTLGADPDLIDLTNPFGRFTGAVSAGGVTLNLLDGGDIVRQAYPLIAWDADTTLSGVDLSDFTVVWPPLYDGELRFGANGLEVNVTTLPPTATMILLR